MQTKAMSMGRSLASACASVTCSARTGVVNSSPVRCETRSPSARIASTLSGQGSTKTTSSPAWTMCAPVYAPTAPAPTIAMRGFMRFSPGGSSQRVTNSHRSLEIRPELAPERAGGVDAVLARDHVEDVVVVVLVPHLARLAAGDDGNGADKLVVLGAEPNLSQAAVKRLVLARLKRLDNVYRIEAAHPLDTHRPEQGLHEPDMGRPTRVLVELGAERGDEVGAQGIAVLQLPVPLEGAEHALHQRRPKLLRLEGREVGHHHPHARQHAELRGLLRRRHRDLPEGDVDEHVRPRVGDV